MRWLQPFPLVVLLPLASALTVSSCAPATEAPKEQASGIPRMPDGKPNFNGVWAGPGWTHTGKETDVPRPPLYSVKNMALVRPEAKELLYRKPTGDVRLDDPTGVCLPSGMTRMMQAPYSQQWVQTPDQLVILYEFMHFFRVIPVGPPNRPHDPDIEPTYMGDSIAWWEGDTLVIDTIGLKEWLLDAYHGEDGSSRWHSDKMHVVERITYTDAVNADYKVTLDDPVIFTQPFSEDWRAERKPTWKILEFICDDNDRCRGGNCVPSDAQTSTSE